LLRGETAQQMINDEKDNDTELKFWGKRRKKGLYYRKREANLD